MAFIESAFYGDERSQRNATKVLTDKITGTTLDVDVNEQLIPPFVVAAKAEITDLEERALMDKAVKQCGGVDQACIRTTSSRLRQEALVAKSSESNSTATAVVGRRLTVNIIDANNERKRIVIPDGQKFSLADVSPRDPKQKGLAIPSVSDVQTQLIVLGSAAFGAMIYVFSIAATWTLFAQHTEQYIAVVLTILATIVPYSGFLMIFVYFMGRSAINTYIEKV